MRNEIALVALRPDLSHLETANSSDIEKFQNATLRPILKLQHNLLVALFRELPNFLNMREQSKSIEDFKSDVILFMKNQTDLKNFVAGLVVGHFTMEEYTTYNANKREFNKRIVQMSGERVADALWSEGFV